MDKGFSANNLSRSLVKESPKSFSEVTDNFSLRVCPLSILTEFFSLQMNPNGSLLPHWTISWKIVKSLKPKWMQFSVNVIKRLEKEEKLEKFFHSIEVFEDLLTSAAVQQENITFSWKKRQWTGKRLGKMLTKGLLKEKFMIWNWRKGGWSLTLMNPSKSADTKAVRAESLSFEPSHGIAKWNAIRRSKESKGKESNLLSITKGVQNQGINIFSRISETWSTAVRTLSKLLSQNYLCFFFISNLFSLRLILFANNYNSGYDVKRFAALTFCHSLFLVLQNVSSARVCI